MGPADRRVPDRRPTGDDGQLDADSGRPTALYAGLAVVVLLAIGLTAWFLLRDDGSETAPATTTTERSTVAPTTVVTTAPPATTATTAPTTTPSESATTAAAPTTAAPTAPPTSPPPTSPPPAPAPVDTERIAERVGREVAVDAKSPMTERRCDPYDEPTLRCDIHVEGGETFAVVISIEPDGSFTWVYA